MTAELSPAVPPALVGELDRQVETLLAKGYPQLAGLSERRFRQHVRPLHEQLPFIGEVYDDHVPFVLVVSPSLVPPREAVAALRLKDKVGFTDMEAADLARYAPIPGVAVPDRPVYLITDVDTGDSTLNIPPRAALPMITGEGRSPLTISEGIALVTQRPERLRKNHCFSLLADRCGDKRVTALWISQGRPRLGWCFEGAPHTWLGSASARERLG